MMQDWANRLDLWAQSKHEAASLPLTIRLEGTASLPEAVGAASSSLVYEVTTAPKRVSTLPKTEGVPESSTATEGGGEGCGLRR